ncbi:MAG TPA: hypothetical protein VNE63_08340 [Candidatus Acidoferrales bacterium]|nr:hypothetical protein [Candidatus Acidoferrales bacterium]
MNYELRIANWAAARVLLAICVLLWVICDSSFLFAQQPQAPAGTPLYSVNAKYVNGMAPGYGPTAGNGLALNLSSGTAYCGNPPSPAPYAGGTLTLSPSTTNYVYLDPAASCAPAVSTAGFSVGAIPIAEVITGASSITTLTDERTWSSPNPAAMSSSGAVQVSALGTNQNITLSPSGTGASVITNLADKGGQVFNVKAYGALGDGTTNDSPAFQAAYNAAVAAGGGTVLIPPTSSCYLFNQAINMTSTAGLAMQVIIQGTTRGRGGAGSGATDLICANTGGIVFDLAGSNGISFYNIAVTSQHGVTNPSLIGIYVARDSSGNGGQGIKVIDSVFDMVTHSSGTTYSFGAYLYASEDDYFTRDVFDADYPLVVSTTNDFTQNSAFITEATGAHSETQDSFTDMEFGSSGLGPAAYFNGTADMTLTGHVWNFGQANPYPAALYNYALEFKGSNSSAFVKFRQEGYPGWASVTLSLHNCQFYGTTAPGATTPLYGISFADSSSILSGDVFHISDEYASASSNAYYYSSGGVAVLDDVSFYCGNETNCGNIPVGNYQPGGWSLYQADVRYSGSQVNEHPTFTTTGSGILTRFPNSAATISFGSGAPSGSCVTPSLYLRTDGGTSTTLYVCESGAWAAK